GRADDLEQRRAAASEVHEAVVGADRAAGRAARVHGLRGVLFEVRTDDADLTLALGGREQEPALAAERRLVLADLVALRQVGIEVVLAREDGVLGDLAVECETELDRHLDRATVRNWEGAR